METKHENRFRKKKKQRRIIVLSIVTVLLIGCGVLGYFAWNSLSLTNESSEEVYKDEYSIEKYEYYLRNNATDLQKEIFKELKDIAEGEEIDMIAYSEAVAKNFVADYYTWTNKNGVYDVGGLCYFYDLQRSMKTPK